MLSPDVDVTSCLSLANILGVTVVPKHEKYLGLPTVVGRSKREAFEGIKERILKKLQCWSSKQLSQAGRSVLLKTVILAISNYVMCCFRLPNSLRGEIESMMAIFFWSCGIDTKIHWLSWDKLCNPKEGGGLDFRRLKECNLALLAKEAWHVAMSPDKLGSSPSFTWRSLLAPRDILVARLRWKVGNGQSIPLLGQSWLPRPRTFQPVSRLRSLGADARVAELITASRGWKIDLILAEFHPMDAECILSIDTCNAGEQDKLVWHFEHHGNISVSSAYSVERMLSSEEGSSGTPQQWKFLWKSKAQPKVLLFAWRAARNA
ncbi:UNVERIFIED_CONTAM: hypothetical protein Slati_2947200 [Sesamum latifolium]|uniref:Reverse transcriptase zinc-binding domain-containing protein n=1 Tax=Sesamum latifolium TaxID=2727402 RepID=A0AAW2VFH5_9LAMI